MGVLAMLTADLIDPSVWNYHTTYVYAMTNQARTGTRSFRYEYSGTYSYIQLTENGEVSPKTTFYTRFAIYRNNTNNVEIRMYDDSGSGDSARITLYLTGSTIELYRGSVGGTLLDTASKPSLINQWEVYEYKVTIDNSSGEFILKQNGIEIINFSGDTQGGPNNNVRNLWFYLNGAGYMYLDDIIVRDDDWPGRGGIHVLVPNSGSATENWSASAGNPEDCVDELPVSYSDYVYTPHDPSGVEHLFNLEALSVSGDIKAVGVAYNAKLEVSTDGNCRNIIRSGSSMESGVLRGLNTDATWSVDYFDTDPATAGAWTAAAIESLEIGVEN